MPDNTCSSESLIMVCSLSDVARQRAVALAMLLTGALLVQPALQAPTTGRAWDAPCGTHKEDTGKTPAPHVRHPAMKAVKRVRLQIRVANNHYKKEMHHIDKLYAGVSTEFKSKHFNYSWLPKQQLPRYRAELRCLNKTARMEQLLPSLHTSLQIYLVTFEELNSFSESIQDPQDDSNTKKRVLDEMEKELKKVLCEVESAILSWNLKMPARVSENIIPRSDRNLWDAQPDHTMSLMQTWGVLTSYKKFLLEWQKIIQEAMKKSPSECTPGGGTRKADRPPGKKPGPGTRRKVIGGRATSTKANVAKTDNKLAPKNGEKRKSPAPKHKKQN